MSNDESMLAKGFCKKFLLDRIEVKAILCTAEVVSKWYVIGQRRKRKLQTKSLFSRPHWTFLKQTGLCLQNASFTISWYYFSSHFMSEFS